MAEHGSTGDHISESGVPGGGLITIDGRVTATRCEANKVVALLHPIPEARVRALRERYGEKYRIDTDFADGERRRLIAVAKAERIDERKGRGALAKILQSIGRRGSR